MNDTDKLLNVVSAMSLALGGDGSVTLKKLGGAYVNTSRQQLDLLRYEASAQGGSVVHTHRSATSSDALLRVMIAQAALLRNVRDNLADQMNTADRLLFEAQEMKDLLNDE